jgi:hypothetical protein
MQPIFWETYAFERAEPEDPDSGAKHLQTFNLGT